MRPSRSRRESGELPEPRPDEERGDFVPRCISELARRGYRVEQARRACEISWRRSDVEPPDTRTARGAWAVAPPPVRPDVPDRLGDRFDGSLRLSRGRFRSDFLAAAEDLGELWDIDDLEAELARTGSLEDFLTGSAGLGGWALFADRLRDTWEGRRDDDGIRQRRDAPAVRTFVAASDAAQAGAPIDPKWWRYERWTDNALSFVDRVGASRITRISDGAKEGVREILRVSFRDGIRREAVARSIVALDGGVDGIRIGLDKRRAGAYMKYVLGLDESIPPSRRIGLMSREYQRLLRSRARSIAQTEVVSTANEAQDETIQAAVRDGEIDSDLYVLEWVARTIACERCLAMDGKTRELTGGVFVSDLGETAERPELHPNGWCFTRTVLRSEASSVPSEIGDEGDEDAAGETST